LRHYDAIDFPLSPAPLLGVAFFANYGKRRAFNEADRRGGAFRTKGPGDSLFYGKVTISERQKELRKAAQIDTGAVIFNGGAR